MFSLKIDLDQSQAILTWEERLQLFLYMFDPARSSAICSFTWIFTNTARWFFTSWPSGQFQAYQRDTNINTPTKKTAPNSDEEEQAYISCFHSNLYYKMTSNVLAKIDARNQMTSRRSFSSTQSCYQKNVRNCETPEQRQA